MYENQKQYFDWHACHPGFLCPDPGRHFRLLGEMIHISEPETQIQEHLDAQEAASVPAHSLADLDRETRDYLEFHQKDPARIASILKSRREFRGWMRDFSRMVKM